MSSRPEARPQRDRPPRLRVERRRARRDPETDRVQQMEAALRETWEEAQARVELGPMFAVVDVVHARQVHVFFLGTLGEPRFGAGEETLETRLFAPEEIPWSDISFPSVTIALEQYLRDPLRGKGPLLLTSAPRLRLG